MVSWEYTWYATPVDQASDNIGTDMPHIVSELNNRGLDGWEVCGTIPLLSSPDPNAVATVLFVFKRELSAH